LRVSHFKKSSYDVLHLSWKWMEVLLNF
jgi:hypothetical protein